jgi:aryl-alcohol dehydrogenase-like predicted oxidoreductase
VETLGIGALTAGGVGLGCNNFGMRLDEERSRQVVHAALDAGVTFFDTADVYGRTRSEEFLGRALAGHRDEVVIATKFGSPLGGPDQGGASAQWVAQAVEGSLRRLGTDRIDLYQLHISVLPDDQAVPIRDALEGLVDRGLVRAYAWSTDDPRLASLFAEGPHCTAVQHELNVLNDAPEMLAVCDRLDLASVNRTPLAMGLLTGKFSADSRLPQDDVRGKEPEWMRYFKDGRPVPEWLDRLAAVREVLTSQRRSLAQGALAWIWARSDRTVPIPGVRTVRQVEENAAAMQAGPLTADQVAEIDHLLGR